MSEQGFKVVFEGNIIEGFDEERVKENLAALHKTGKAQIEKIFTGQRVIIKKGLGYESAARYRDAYAKAGAVCLILPMEPSSQKAAAVIKAKTPEPAPTASPNFAGSRKPDQSNGLAADAQQPSGSFSDAILNRPAPGAMRRETATRITNHGRAENENRGSDHSALKIIVLLCAGGFFQYIGHGLRENGVGFGLFVLLGGLILFTWGCVHFSASRGYHKAFGLLGMFSIFGLAALLMFPNRYSTNAGMKIGSCAVGALFFLLVIVGSFWQNQQAREAFAGMEMNAQYVDSKLSVSNPEELNASVQQVETYILQCNKMLKSRAFSDKERLRIFGSELQRIKTLEALMEKEGLPDSTIDGVHSHLKQLAQNGVQGIGASKRGAVQALHDLAVASGNL